MSNDLNYLLHTFDAQVWAKEWLKIIAAKPSIPTDEGAMIAWFANAIGAGYDHARRLSETAKAAEPITDRDSLRRALIADDDRLLTGFLSARMLSAQEKKMLESGIAVLGENQEPTNAFLDLWLAKMNAMG